MLHLYLHLYLLLYLLLNLWCICICICRIEKCVCGWRRWKANDLSVSRGMAAHLISSINLLQSFVASSGTFGIQISVIAVSFQPQHFDQFWKTEKLLKAVKAWLSSYGTKPMLPLLWFLLRPLWGNFQLWRWSGKSLQRQTSKSAPGCHRLSVTLSPRPQSRCYCTICLLYFLYFLRRTVT